MYTLSEILSKPLLSLLEAEIVGVVSNAFFNKKLSKITHLLIVNLDNDSRPEKQLVKVSSCKNLNSDALCIANFDALVQAGSVADLFCSPINKAVYSPQGTLLGTVNDVVFLENGTVVELRIANKDLPLSYKNILSNSESLMLYNDLQSPFRLKKRKAIKVPTAATGVVKVHLQ